MAEYQKAEGRIGAIGSRCGRGEGAEGTNEQAPDAAAQNTQPGVAHRRRPGGEFVILHFGPSLFTELHRKYRRHARSLKWTRRSGKNLASLRVS